MEKVSMIFKERTSCRIDNDTVVVCLFDEKNGYTLEIIDTSNGNHQLRYPCENKKRLSTLNKYAKEYGVEFVEPESIIDEVAEGILTIMRNWNSTKYGKGGVDVLDAVCEASGYGFKTEILSNEEFFEGVILSQEYSDLRKEYRI